jgi:hypothetical protein
VRHALAAVACVLLAVASTAGAQTTPRLRIVDLQPRLVVRGASFTPRRLVRVTLHYNLTRRIRYARTTSKGAFVVVLGPLPGFDPCHSFFQVLALGRAGDRAELEFTPRECPNP